MKPLPDVRINDIWQEGDYLHRDYNRPEHQRRVVATVTLARVTKPDAKHSTVKRSRFDGSKSGYKLVTREEA